jgi:hypothetical protein
VTIQNTPGCACCGCPSTKYPKLDVDRITPTFQSIVETTTEIETIVATRIVFRRREAGVDVEFSDDTDTESTTTDPETITTIVANGYAGKIARHVASTGETATTTIVYDPPAAETDAIADYTVTTTIITTTTKVWRTYRYRASMVFDVSAIDWTALRDDAVTSFYRKLEIAYRVYQLGTTRAFTIKGFATNSDHPADAAAFDSAWAAASSTLANSAATGGGVESTFKLIDLTASKPTTAIDSIRILADSPSEDKAGNLRDCRLIVYPWYTLTAPNYAHPDWHATFTPTTAGATRHWRTRSSVGSHDTQFEFTLAIDGESDPFAGFSSDDYAFTFALLKSDGSEALSLNFDFGTGGSKPAFLAPNSGFVSDLVVTGLGIDETLKVTLLNAPSPSFRVSLYDDTLMISYTPSMATAAGVAESRLLCAYKLDETWNTHGNSIVFQRPRFAPDYIDAGKVTARVSTDADHVHLTSLAYIATEPLTVINSPRAPYDPALTNSTIRKWCPLPLVNCANFNSEESLRLTGRLEYTPTFMATLGDHTLPLSGAQCLATGAFPLANIFGTEVRATCNASVTLVDGDYILTVTLSFPDSVYFVGPTGLTMTWTIPLGTTRLDSFRDIPVQVLDATSADNWATLIAIADPLIHADTFIDLSTVVLTLTPQG